MTISPVGERGSSRLTLLLWSPLDVMECGALQEEAYNRIMELNGAVMDDRWVTIADA